MEQNLTDFAVFSIIFGIAAFIWIGFVAVEDRRFNRHAQQALDIVNEEDDK